MSHLENGNYQEEAYSRNEPNNRDLADEISVKVRWLQDYLVEGPQYGPASVKVFREDIRTNLIKKFGGPVSDLEIGVVLRRAFPHHVRRGKFYCGIGKPNNDNTQIEKNSLEEATETKNQTNSIREMSESVARDSREVQVPMKKRMIIRDLIREEEQERKERIEEKPEIIQKSIPEQTLYKPSLSHPQISAATPHIVVAPSPVLASYGQSYSQGVLPTQTPIPHHFSLPTSVVDQRTLSPLEAQQRYHHFSPYAVPGVPQDLLNPFALVSRPGKRHEHGPVVLGDHSSPHKKAKKQKRLKEGRLDMPQSPKGLQGPLMPLGSSAVQPIILNFDVPAPKISKVKSLEERLPDEFKFGGLTGASSDGLSDYCKGSGDGGTALQDHQVTSELGHDGRQTADSQGMLKSPPSPERYPSYPQKKPPPFIPKALRAEDAERLQREETGKEVSPFKVPSINQYKASVTGSSSAASQPILKCSICKNQLHPGSRDYPLKPSFIITCLRCKKIAFGKPESKPASLPKFPAACNPRVAPSEEVSALRRRKFWKCLINHHKTTKQLRRKGRIPRVVVNNRPRSVSSSVCGSYPSSPQPMSPMSTCTAPSPCTSMPPSPASQTGMSVPGSPLSQLPSPSVSPHPQDKRGRSLHPPSLIPDGHFSGGSRPVNSPKISSSGNDMRRISQADPSEERLDIPNKGAQRQPSPGAVSDVTMSPDSISLPPGRENEDATVRALLSLSSTSSGDTKGKLEVPADISARRHSSPSLSSERRYALREFPLASSRLADSTENSQRVIQDYLDRQDLKYLKEDTRQRTFMISGQFVEGLKSSKPYEAFCCTCMKEDLVFIRCPTRGCEFVCNSISSMQMHEEGHITKGEANHFPSSPMRDGLYEDAESRSSVETQSADTDVEAKSPSSVSLPIHSKREESSSPVREQPHTLVASSSSVIDLGTTGHHVSVPRTNPQSLKLSSSRAVDPTSPLDLSGKGQYLGAPMSAAMLKEKSSPSSPFTLGSPLDLSSQTKHGYSDIVSYQAAHNREKEQFVSNPMLGSTGKVIERPSAPAANMMPSIQIPLPTTAVSLPTPITAQLPTLVNPGNLPFFYTPFIPYQPPGSVTSGIPLSHPILMGSASTPTRPEKPPMEEPRVYQGPFAFLNQVQAAARNRAMAKANPAPASNRPQPETPSPTSSSSSGSWHREKLREASPTSRSLNCSPQRASNLHPAGGSPQSVSYQGGTISIQTSPTTLSGHRRISPKTVKIESPFQRGMSSPSSTDCVVQVKVEQCSDDEVNHKESPGALQEKTLQT